MRRLDQVFAEWLPDMATAMKPENHDMIDALVCLMGECFIRFAGAHWIDWQSWDDEHSFYDHVNPAVNCDTPDEDELGMWVIVKDMSKFDPEVDDGMFSYFTSALRECAGYQDDYKGAASEPGKTRGRAEPHEVRIATRPPDDAVAQGGLAGGPSAS